MNTTAIVFAQPAATVLARAILDKLDSLDHELQKHAKRHTQNSRQATVDEMESLHQLRVNTRHIRSLLQAAQTVLPDKICRLRSDYAAQIRNTNSIRDQHVLLSQLRIWAEEATTEEALTCRWIEQHFTVLDQSSSLASAALSHHWLKLFQRLNQKLQRQLTKHGKPKSTITLGQLLAQRIRRLAQQLRQRIDAVDTQGLSELHRARLDIKKLRYLLTPWRPYLGQYTATLSLLRHLQDVLGVMHDQQTQQIWLRNKIPVAVRCHLQNEISPSNADDPNQPLSVETLTSGLLALYRRSQREYHDVSTVTLQFLNREANETLFDIFGQLAAYLENIPADKHH